MNTIFQIKTNNIPIKNNYVSNPIFKSNDINNQTDVVEIQNKERKKEKNGLSKGKKWLLGIIGGIAVLGISAKYCSKAFINKAFKEKCSFLNLPENIEFKKAENINDAIKFAKETLKIKEVDKDFPLDIINMINKELTYISNIQKGKVCMPQALRFKGLSEQIGGEISSNIRYNSFGEITINKNILKEEYLDNVIDMLISQNKEYIISGLSGIPLPANRFIYKPNFDKKFINLVDKFTKDKKMLSIEEKLDLNLSLQNMDDKITMITHSPETFFKINKNKLKEFGIDVDLKKYAQMSDGEKCKYKMNVIDTLAKNSQSLPINLDYVPAGRIIRHEMGHLQDYAKNYKEFYKNGNELDRWNVDIKHIKEGLKNEKTNGFIKKHYPLTCEFLEPKTQNIAGEVSEYAKRTISEFMAETYADLLAGRKFSDEVMELYKKYNGVRCVFSSSIIS